MKNKKNLCIAIIALIIVISLFAFSGCKPKPAVAADIDLIKESITHSRDAQNYLVTSREILGRTKASVYTLTVFGNKADANKSIAKFTATIDEIVASTNVSQYYGKSLPSTIKPKKAKDSDWKTYHFYCEKYFDFGKGKGENRYKLAESGFEEFLAKEDINPHTLDKTLDLFKLIADANISLEKIMVTKQGKIVEYKIADIGKELAVKIGFKVTAKNGSEKTTFPAYIEITNGRVSMLTDSKDDPSKTYSISYQGPNIVMPNYDKVY